MKKILFSFLIFVLLIGTSFVVFKNYSYFFSKKIDGVVINVDRVTELSGRVANSKTKDSQIHSYAIAIRSSKDGNIFTTSSEDRQWAVINNGNCVVARLYPYPPWNFKKSGTYHNARLEKLRDCEPQENSKTGHQNKRNNQQNLINNSQDNTDAAQLYQQHYINLKNYQYSADSRFMLWTIFYGKKLSKKIEDWSRNLPASDLDQTKNQKLILQQKKLEIAIKEFEKANSKNWESSKWEAFKQISLTEQMLNQNN